jgi:SpoVK/Ycf46/Vps4 family AAA+-type ATPase
LAEIARGVATEPGELPKGTELDRLLDAAAGMTRAEAENAFGLGLVRHRRLEASTIWQLKAAELKKSNLLTLYRGEETFAGLGGLESLKGFCLRALRPKSPDKPRARGIVLLGPPGTGKTATAKALGNETARPTLILDPGSLMASLVGQTEERTRQALRIIDAFGPCIVVIDEVDHALAGHNSNGDSGVMSRFFGQMQTWLNDHTSDAFVVCTSNDISTLPAAFTRAERFDGVFYVDLPGVTQKRTIWRIYVEKYGLDATQPKPVDADWSGAEIRACCRLAALLDVPLVEAAQNVVPVARTAHESVERLRTWAAGRCLSADQPGVYTANPGAVTPKPGRKVRRDASMN